MELRATHVTQGKLYHEAVAVIVQESGSEKPSGRVDCFPEWENDPRWPTRCECGHAFTGKDPRYVDRPTLWQRSDTGELVTLHDAPPGAMWYADWYPAGQRGPDGHVLIVNTPAGHWNVDGKSTNGSGWERFGVPPRVTANPSILFHPHRVEGHPEPQGGYHGWLRDGKLIEVP